MFASTRPEARAVILPPCLTLRVTTHLCVATKFSDCLCLWSLTLILPHASLTTNTNRYNRRFEDSDTFQWSRVRQYSHYSQQLLSTHHQDKLFRIQSFLFVYLFIVFMKRDTKEYAIYDIIINWDKLFHVRFNLSLLTEEHQTLLTFEIIRRNNPLWTFRVLLV